MKKILVMCVGIIFLFSCKENDNIIGYDIDDSYVYFAYPNPNTKEPEKFTDSLYYSFALDESIGIDEKVLKIPVNIAGLSKNVDRKYSFKIGEGSSYDPSTIAFSEPIIRANQVTDTLYITLQRTKELATKDMRILLQIEANNEFKVGNEHNRSLELIYSDVLVEPTWWKTWRDYMGPFYKEVLQKWMQIYYLGSDMSPDLTTGATGPIYYWNNMPSSARASWYPITFMYLDVLKKYFNDNVVYPNGDTTKDRILLP